MDESIVEMILVPIISLIVLFVLTKLMGSRQVSQLGLFDYIIGITIGSIASEFVMGGYEDYPRPLIAMIVYAIFTVCISWLARHSIKSRKFIDGHAIVLYENNCLYNEQLDKAKLDIDEFLMQCRINGYFNLNELELVVLETNGNLSFMPKEKFRPAQLGDLQVKVQEVTPPTVLVKEGVVFEKHLTQINKDKHWLENTLHNAGTKLEDIIMMYQEDNSNIQIFTKNKNERNFD